MRWTVLVGPRGDRFVAEVPSALAERLRGLLGRDRLPRGRALLIERARSVHTIGMRFEITVAFLDRDLRVLEVLRVPPGRVLRPRLRARHVLELAPDADVRAGDPLRGENPDEGVEQGRRERQDRDEQDERPSGPGWERHGLAAGGIRLDNPEELQQRPHGNTIGVPRRPH